MRLQRVSERMILGNRMEVHRMRSVLRIKTMAEKPTYEEPPIF
jgi:hypothetical protein